MAQSNEAIAEKLFLDGRTLLAAGSVHEACARFADSQRLDPALGTLMNLALCNEKDHRPATAWSQFTEAAKVARSSGQHDREEFARAHATALEKQLQKVRIDVQAPPPGTVVKLDSQVLPGGILGTDIPLDPGDHDLEVSAPGKKTWHQAKLALGNGTTVMRVQVVLEDEPLAAPASDVPPTPAGPVPAPSEAAKPGGGGLKTALGFAVGGAGIVLLGVAAVEESISLSRHSDESKYSGPALASQRETVANQSRDAQTYAIAFGAGGLVAVGVGMYLVLSAHTGAPARVSSTATLTAAPVLGPHDVGVSLHGDF